MFRPADLRLKSVMKSMLKDEGGSDSEEVFLQQLVPCTSEMLLKQFQISTKPEVGCISYRRVKQCGGQESVSAQLRTLDR